MLSWRVIAFLLILPGVTLQTASIPLVGELERVPIALLFWYIPDHGDVDTVTPYWHDPGFRGAMRLLHLHHKLDAVWFNIAKEGVSQQLEQSVKDGNFAFVLSKGCWHTPSDKFMRSTIIPNKPCNVKTGIFPACSSPPPNDEVTGVRLDMAYDVLFYDKLWLEPTFSVHPFSVHAFGVDSPNTFNTSGLDWAEQPKVFDYVSVGMFAPWKRHEAILVDEYPHPNVSSYHALFKGVVPFEKKVDNVLGPTPCSSTRRCERANACSGLQEKSGTRLVVGYGWRSEVSSGIVSTLFSSGVAVWQQVPPERMCTVYRASRRLLMAATDLGGGERVLLEARACGMPVEAIELLDDNSKLAEFLRCPLYSTADYAAQFAYGIRSVLPRPVETLTGSQGGATKDDSKAPEPFRISV